MGWTTVEGSSRTKGYHLPLTQKEGYVTSTGTHGPQDECDMHHVTADGMPQR
jgi:hypothetical protein